MLANSCFATLYENAVRILRSAADFVEMWRKIEKASRRIH